MGEKSLTYKDAGVDTKEGERAVSLMKDHVKKTFDSRVLTGLGGFGSLFKPDIKNMESPVLVAGTDGVGTKLKLAFMMDRHDTVGQDLVAMCVNDVLCQGASPLFFLDYIATGKVEAEKISDIVKGISDGCLVAECALVGGETAEMPGFYATDEYDLAGFAVGMVDEKKIIDGSEIKAGDVIIGIPSTGIHSNGYSLARKIFFEKNSFNITDKIEELGETLGDALLRPTAIYTKQVKTAMKNVECKGIVHITGGGFYENIPRIIPAGLGARIDKGAWEMPKIFNLMQRLGEISDNDMFSTFNMGIGMMFVVDAKDGEILMKSLRDSGSDAFHIGDIVTGEGVKIEG